MYDWGPHSPFTVLLLHNAMAVIVAVILCQVMRGRLIIAVIATLLAVAATYYLRETSISHRVGWWRLLQAPLDSWGQVQDDRVLFAYTLLAGLLAPFVFALFTAWRWTSGRRGKPIPFLQMRLRSIVVITTVACLAIGFTRWLAGTSIAYVPTIVAAIVLMLRPGIVFRDWRIQVSNRMRLEEARRRWRPERVF